MREMKDSGIQWIGKIPKNWDVRPIKNSFSIVSGSTPDSDKAEYWEGGIPWITPADFKTIDKYTSGGSRFITEKGYDSCSTNMIPKGSIIFSKRAPIGSVVINKIDLCTNQGCLSCIKNDKTDSTYFYYLMSIYDDVFNLFGSGTTFKEISATTFGDFILPLPPLVEQQLVSSFLDSKCAEIDALTADIQKEIEMLQEYRKSVITEAVTKGLDPNAEMKESGIEWIGDIPRHWTTIKLKNTHDGMNVGESIDKEYWEESDGDIVFYTAGLNPITTTYRHFPPEKYTRDNDLLLARNGTPYVYLPIENSVYTDHIIRVKIKDGYSKKYIMYCLQRSINAEIVDTVSIATWSSSIWNRQCFPLPSYEEQIVIASYLDSKCSEIDSLISDKQKQLETLAEYRKSLIYEYVTGKKEVPTT